MFSTQRHERNMCCFVCLVLCFGLVVGFFCLFARLLVCLSVCLPACFEHHPVTHKWSTNPMTSITEKVDPLAPPIMAQKDSSSSHEMVQNPGCLVVFSELHIAC